MYNYFCRSVHTEEDCNNSHFTGDGATPTPTATSQRELTAAFVVYLSGISNELVTLNVSGTALLHQS